jgi:molybdate/tungstate transport system ATP-binding protein
MIQVSNLSIHVGSFFLNDLSFQVPQGQYSVLMGKTGSGKTTLLESICGLRRVAKGAILLDNQNVTDLKPAQRGIGLVPQDGSLFPRMTVADHLEFSLEVRRWPHRDRRARVAELTSLLQLGSLLARYPINLSGGERQRVALGRALAFRPKILCLDEPLSALDDDTRDEMIEFLKRVQKETGVTALHVTHNRREANELADIRLLLAEGKLSVVEHFGKGLPPVRSKSGATKAAGPSSAPG